MVNQTTRYALHILGYLARNNDELVPGGQIARDSGIPANYLSKILNQLRKSGIVESRKGWGGGFRLRDDAHQRPLLEIVRIFEGDKPVGIPACIYGLPECDDNNPCPLHSQWVGIRESLDQMLEMTTIGELKSRPLGIPGCDAGQPRPPEGGPLKG